MKSPLQIRLDYQAKMRELKKSDRKKNKFNAKFSKGGDGRGRHSELEHSVAGIIRQRVASGELALLKEQDKLEFYLFGVRILAYIADFKVQRIANAEIFWIEAKGFEVEKWSIVRALWRACGPGHLEIWKGSAASPKMTEIVIPKNSCPDIESGWRI